MQKYANKICKNMQNICKNIRVYVFAYGAYICTPHFADDYLKSLTLMRVTLPLFRPLIIWNLGSCHIASYIAPYTYDTLPGAI